MAAVYYLPSWQVRHKARLSVGGPGAVYHTSSDPKYETVQSVHCVWYCTAVYKGIRPACLCQGFAVKMSVIALLKCPDSHQRGLVAMSLTPCTVHLVWQCNKLLCAKFMAELPLLWSAQCYNSAKVGGCSCPGRRMLDPKAGFTILLPPIKSHRHHYSLTHYSDRIRSFTKSPERRSYRFQSLSYQWFERRNTLVTDIFDIYLTCCPKVDKQIGTILQRGSNNYKLRVVSLHITVSHAMSFH